MVEFPPCFQFKCGISCDISVEYLNTFFPIKITSPLIITTLNPCTKLQLHRKVGIGGRRENFPFAPLCPARQMIGAKSAVGEEGRDGIR